MMAKAKSSLPPGFRFHPTDEELVAFYLKKKVMGKKLGNVISEIELYRYAPSELPDKSCLRTKDREWYFFCPRDRKYPNGLRSNRATSTGYWKTSGKDRSITHNNRPVGMKRTLIYHEGKPLRGDRTDWVMYEYRLVDKEVADAGFSLDSYVLCKIFEKSGIGPRIGEQYGALFNEDDWEDESGDEDELNMPFQSFCTGRTTDNNVQESAGMSSVATISIAALPVELSPNVGCTSININDEFLKNLKNFLNDAPLPLGDSGFETPNLAMMPNADAEASDVSSSEIYRSLEDLVQEGHNSTGFCSSSSFLSANVQLLQPEFESGYIMELNDLYLPENAADNLFYCNDLHGITDYQMDFPVAGTNSTPMNTSTDTMPNLHFP